MEKDTESRILIAAEEEFISKGFSGARTTSIAQKAGVTHAMLHYYFRTKEKLYDRIVSEKFAVIKENVIHSINLNNKSLEDLIKNLITNHLDFLSRNPYLPRFFIGELYSDSKRATILKEKIHKLAPYVIKLFQDVIDSFSNQGACRKVDARSLLLDIISLNIFPFLASPLVNTFLTDDCVASGSFIESRKRENFETIMNKLRTPSPITK